MPREYKLYLSDILEALERIQEYTKSMTFKDFAKSNITIDAVVRNLEVIGEAARKLPSEIKSKSPEVEWRKIVALRNILTHEYFGVNIQIGSFHWLLMVFVHISLLLDYFIYPSDKNKI